jgi:hypothetical protein
MVIVETIGRVRREHFVKGRMIKEIARHELHGYSTRTPPMLG